VDDGTAGAAPVEARRNNVSMTQEPGISIGTEPTVSIRPCAGKEYYYV